MNSDESEKRLVEREKRLEDMNSSIYNDIMQIEGLSDKEKFSAYVKIISDENYLIAFYAAPIEGRAPVVREMIA